MSDKDILKEIITNFITDFYNHGIVINEQYQPSRDNEINEMKSIIDGLDIIYNDTYNKYLEQLIKCDRDIFDAIYEFNKVNKGDKDFPTDDLDEMKKLLLQLQIHTFINLFKTMDNGPDNNKDNVNKIISLFDKLNTKLTTVNDINFNIYNNSMQEITYSKALDEVSSVLDQGDLEVEQTLEETQSILNIYESMANIFTPNPVTGSSSSSSSGFYSAFTPNSVFVGGGSNLNDDIIKIKADINTNNDKTKNLKFELKQLRETFEKDKTNKSSADDYITSFKQKSNETNSEIKKIKVSNTNNLSGLNDILLKTINMYSETNNEFNRKNIEAYNIINKLDETTKQFISEACKIKSNSRTGGDTDKMPNYCERLKTSIKCSLDYNNISNTLNTDILTNITNIKRTIEQSESFLKDNKTKNAIRSYGEIKKLVDNIIKITHDNNDNRNKMFKHASEYILLLSKITSVIHKKFLDISKEEVNLEVNKNIKIIDNIYTNIKNLRDKNSKLIISKDYINQSNELINNYDSMIENLNNCITPMNKNIEAAEDAAAKAVEEAATKAAEKAAAEKAAAEKAAKDAAEDAAEKAAKDAAEDAAEKAAKDAAEKAAKDAAEDAAEDAAAKAVEEAATKAAEEAATKAAEDAAAKAVEEAATKAAEEAAAEEAAAKEAAAKVAAAEEAAAKVAAAEEAAAKVAAAAEARKDVFEKINTMFDIKSKISEKSLDINNKYDMINKFYLITKDFEYSELESINKEEINEYLNKIMFYLEKSNGENTSAKEQKKQGEDYYNIFLEEYTQYNVNFSPENIDKYFSIYKRMIEDYNKNPDYMNNLLISITEIDEKANNIYNEYTNYIMKHSISYKNILNDSTQNNNKFNAIRNSVEMVHNLLKNQKIEEEEYKCDVQIDDIIKNIGENIKKGDEYLQKVNDMAANNLNLLEEITSSSDIENVLLVYLKSINISNSIVDANKAKQNIDNIYNINESYYNEINTYKKLCFSELQVKKDDVTDTSGTTVDKPKVPQGPLLSLLNYRQVGTSSSDVVKNFTELFENSTPTKLDKLPYITDDDVNDARKDNEILDYINILYDHIYIYSNDIILKIFTLISYKYNLTEIYPTDDPLKDKQSDILGLINNCIISKDEVITISDTDNNHKTDPLLLAQYNRYLETFDIPDPDWINEQFENDTEILKRGNYLDPKDKKYIFIYKFISSMYKNNLDNISNHLDIIIRLVFILTYKMKNLTKIINENLINRYNEIDFHYNKCIEDNKNMYSYVRERTQDGMRNPRYNILDYDEITKEYHTFNNPNRPKYIIMDYKNNDKTNKDIKNEDTSERYFFGPYDRVFPSNLTNYDITEGIKSNIFKHLFPNDISLKRPLCLIGYGQSGSGKTSLLINYKKLDENGVLEEQTGIIIKLLQLPRFTKKVNSIELLATNIYTTFTDSLNKNKITKENYNTTNLLSGTPDSPAKFNFQGSNWKNDKAENISEFIIDLFDKRQIAPTPNNIESSRSHIIICLRLLKDNIKVNDIFICDLAGVENEFNCIDIEEIYKFDKNYRINTKIPPAEYLNKWALSENTNNSKLNNKWAEIDKLIKDTGNKKCLNLKGFAHWDTHKGNIEILKNNNKNITDVRKLMTNVKEKYEVLLTKKNHPKYYPIEFLFKEVYVKFEYDVDRFKIVYDIYEKVVKKYPNDDRFPSGIRTYNIVPRTDQEIMKYFYANETIMYNSRSDWQFDIFNEMMVILNSDYTVNSDIDCEKYLLLLYKYNCAVRVNEGYIINNSLKELREDINNIMIEKSKIKLNDDKYITPLFFEKEIFPYCRNINYQNNFDEKNNIKRDKGIILDTISTLGTDIDVNNLIFNIFTIINTSTDINNPPDPPYINTNDLNYVINKKNIKKEKVLLEIFNILTKINTYKFYDNFYREMATKYNNSNGLNDLSYYRDLANKIYTFIQNNNAATLIGSLESTDNMQNMVYNKMACFQNPNTYKNLFKINQILPLRIFNNNKGIIDKIDDKSAEKITFTEFYKNISKKLSLLKNPNDISLTTAKDPPTDIKQLPITNKKKTKSSTDVVGAKKYESYFNKYIKYKNKYLSLYEQ